MNKKGYITAIGLGPGDAELLTIKGYNALKKADVIYYPASSIKEDNITSFSIQIVNDLDLNIPAKPMHLPMKSRERMKYYQQAYNFIKNDYQSGKKIAIVCEGDILFYSTFGYLLKFIQKDSFNYSIIPGIPAFIAAGSLGENPLIEGNKSLKIAPCPNDFGEIEKLIKGKDTLILMKLSKIINWDSFFKKLTLPFLYAEKIGTASQFFTSNTNDIIGRRIPYFSILIIYNNKENIAD
jgi:precorrin-2/cobalt-factor-2 C20-methyltransferase